MPFGVTLMFLKCLNFNRVEVITVLNKINGEKQYRTSEASQMIYKTVIHSSVSN